jgi:hypothetical protein
MTIALKPARQHNYRLSAYERKANDFYPTPSDLAVSLALGLSRLRLDLPQIALDPCGGDGALRRCLAPFGVDVGLSDLYPEMYPAADGYVTRKPLDASDPEQLRYSFELAGPTCAAIVTNTPHNTNEACPIVKNLIALVEGQHVDFVSALFRAIWGAEPGRLRYLDRPSFHGEILCCWRPRWIPGTKKSPMHAYAWYVWRKTPRSGPSLKVRVGKDEPMASLAAVNLPNARSSHPRAARIELHKAPSPARAEGALLGRPQGGSGRPLQAFGRVRSLLKLLRAIQSPSLPT